MVLISVELCLVLGDLAVATPAILLVGKLNDYII